MKIKNKYLPLVLFCCGMSQAVAEPYIGASFGFSDSDFCDNVDPILDCDGSGGAAKLFGGYKFNSVIGFELAYVASMDMSMSMSMSNTNHYSQTHIILRGLNSSVVGFLPVSENASLSAKVGMFIWQTQGFVSSYSRTETGSDLSLGVGVDYKLSESFTLRGELERFKLDTGTATLLSVGVMWRF